MRREGKPDYYQWATADDLAAYFKIKLSTLYNRASLEGWDKMKYDGKTYYSIKQALAR